MKKTLIGLISMLMLTGMVDTASAASYTLTDTTIFTASGTNDSSDYVGSGSGAVNFLSGSGDYVEWKHQFTFNPTADEITSASLRLTLRDDASGCFPDWPIFLWGDGQEYGKVTTNAADGSLSWVLPEIDTQDYTNIGLSLISLADGAYQVKLSKMWGDFYIDKSVLLVDYNHNDAAPVPEPATMLLFGSGLAGLAAARRRKKASPQLSA